MAYIRDITDRSGLPSIHSSRPYSAGYDLNRSSNLKGIHFAPSTAWPVSTIGGSDPMLLYQPRPPDRTLQAQDQLRMFKEEIARKDKLISQLTAMEGQKSRLGTGEFMKYDDIYSGGSLTMNNMTFMRQDASLQVRVDSLQNQVRELQVQVDTKEAKVREVKLLYEAAREAEAKNSSVMHQLRQTISVYEAQFGQLEGAANRSGVALATLQKENHEAQQRIVELETRLRTHMEERERAEQERQAIERKLMELNSHFGNMFYLDVLNGGQAPSVEQVIEKTRELTQENALLKGQMATMRDHVINVENEVKASRETIARLIGEAERGQMSVSRYTLDMEGIRLERDAAVNRQNDLLREIDELRERLDSTQRAWNTMRREIDERQPCHDPTQITRSLESQNKAFKECLATLLSDGYCNVEPYEEQIRDRVHNLVIAVRDKNAQIETLESQLSHSAAQLDSQLEFNRSVDRKNKRAEADLADMEAKLRQSDGVGWYQTGTDKYIQLLEQLNRVLGMTPFHVELSLEGAKDSVLDRAEQLARHESELADRKTHVHNLQRKVKSLKERLNEKDQILREDASKDKDEENRNKKLVKLVAKYQAELTETHNEIKDLKCRLAEAGDLQTQARMNERDSEKMETRINELEEIRHSQAARISELQDKMRGLQLEQSRGHHAEEELKGAQTALADVTKRNRQLLELRQVIARMLGLDVRAMSVADFEIVQRLEKLILANQASINSTFTIDTSINDMVEGFRRGYESAGDDVYAPAYASPPLKHNRALGRAGAASGRSRSMSPNKRRDSKVY